MQLPARWSRPKKDADRSPGANAPADPLYFPTPLRPETLRLPSRDDPFDVEDDQTEQDRRAQATQAAHDRVGTPGRLTHEEAVAAAQEALAERDRRRSDPVVTPQHHEDVVWQALEAIRTRSDREKDPDYQRTEYVPIAASRRPEAPAENDRQTYVLPYNLPEFSPAPQPTRWDVVRRIATSLSALAALVTSIVVVLGGMPAAFSPHGSTNVLLAPLFPALLMVPAAALAWTVAAGFSWTPNQHSARRQRTSGPVMAVGALATGAWAVCAHQGLMLGALICALVWFAAGLESVRRFNLLTARTPSESYAADGPAEIALGSGAFMTAWTASAATSAWGWSVPPAALWGALTLAAVTVPIVMLAHTERGRVWAPVALSWGTLWLIATQIVTMEMNAAVVFVAGAATVVGVVVAITRRHDIQALEAAASPTGNAPAVPNASPTAVTKTGGGSLRSQPPRGR